MTTEDKKIHVENIIQAADVFDDILTYPRAVFDYRPEEGAWTIHEHVVHCLEVDIANFTRYRLGIVKPGAEIISMDERWTENLHYSSIYIVDAIQAIKIIRKLTHAHFSTLIDDDWKKYSISYDKYGELNFELFVPVYYNHPHAHKDYIDGILESWKKSG